MALLLHVIVLRQWRNQCRAACQLPDTVQDDFCSTIVELNWTMNLDDAACEATHIADVFKIMWEDHHGKRAGRLVFAEVHEVHSFRADLHPYNFPNDAFGLTDVLASLTNGKTVGSREKREGGEKEQGVHERFPT